MKNRFLIQNQFPATIAKCKSQKNLPTLPSPSLKRKGSPKHELQPQHVRKQSQEVLQCTKLDFETPARVHARSRSKMGVGEKMHYESLLEIYKNENQNLQEQNRFLLQELHRYRQKERSMGMYIESMAKEMRKMQLERYQSKESEEEMVGENYMPQQIPINHSESFYSQDNDNKQTPFLRSPRDAPECELASYISEQPLKQFSLEAQKNQLTEKQNSRAATCYSSNIMSDQNLFLLREQENQNAGNDLAKLEKRFNLLLEESSKSGDKEIKRAIRERLAETAQLMRQFHQGQ